MIRIITKTGRELDLSPEMEIQFEQQQPLLSDDKVPVTFSTAITLPASQTNKDILGYLPAMALEPAVKELGVIIFIGGVQITSGTLIYDGMSEGQLQYTFTGADLSARLGRKIDFQKNYNPAQAALGLDPDVALPLVMHDSFQSSVIYKNTGGQEVVEPSDKYRNYFGLREDISSVDSAVLAPAIRIKSLLRGAGAEIIIPESDIVDQAAILCLYNPRYWWSSKSSIDSALVDKNNEPDITYMDVLKAVCRICGAAVYYEGGIMRCITADDVMTADPIVIDGMVSDNYSLEVERGKSYRLAFADDGDNNYDPDSAETESGSREKEVQRYYNIITALGTERDVFYSYKVLESGDVIRSRWHQPPVSGSVIHATFPDSYVLSRAGDVGQGGQEKESFDASCDFKLVKCVPEIVRNQENTVFLMTPIVTPPAADEKPGSDAYIGLIKVNDGMQCQMTDRQFFGTYSASFRGEGDDGVSLAPDALYDGAHKRFAEWMSRDRRVLKAQLHLDAMMLSTLSMAVPVYFHGRKWIIRSLKYTVSAGSGRIESEGEFIEL